jgi:hypothetical protein
LLFHKIDLEQKWTRTCECLQYYTRKISFDHYYKMKYIIWINKQKLLCARLVTKSMCYQQSINWDNNMFNNPNFPIINIYKNFCMNFLLNKNDPFTCHLGDSLIKYSIWNIINYMGRWPTLFLVQMSLFGDKS